MELSCFSFVLLKRPTAIMFLVLRSLRHVAFGCVWALHQFSHTIRLPLLCSWLWRVWVLCFIRLAWVGSLCRGLEGLASQLLRGAGLLS